MIVEILGTFFSSIISGGATGIIGVIVQRWADYKNKELDIQLNKVKYAHELDMRAADAKIMEQEWAGRTKVAQVEADAAENVSANQAFAASFNEPSVYSAKVVPSAGQGWMLITLDFIRGIVRPGLTIYLCLLTTLVYIQAQRQLGDQMSTEHALEIVKMVVGTILYLTTTCLLWWFGVRNKQPAPKIGKGN